jgi:hypothetical protein
MRNCVQIPLRMCFLSIDLMSHVALLFSMNQHIQKGDVVVLFKLHRELDIILKDI